MKSILISFAFSLTAHAVDYVNGVPVSAPGAEFGFKIPPPVPPLPGSVHDRGVTGLNLSPPPELDPTQRETGFYFYVNPDGYDSLSPEMKGVIAKNKEKFQNSLYPPVAEASKATVLSAPVEGTPAAQAYRNYGGVVAGALAAYFSPDGGYYQSKIINHQATVELEDFQRSLAEHINQFHEAHELQLQSLPEIQRQLQQSQASLKTSLNQAGQTARSQTPALRENFRANTVVRNEGFVDALLTQSQNGEHVRQALPPASVVPATKGIGPLGSKLRQESYGAKTGLASRLERERAKQSNTFKSDPTSPEQEWLGNRASEALDSAEYFAGDAGKPRTQATADMAEALLNEARSLRYRAEGRLPHVEIAEYDDTQGRVSLRGERAIPAAASAQSLTQRVQSFRADQVEVRAQREFLTRQLQQPTLSLGGEFAARNRSNLESVDVLADASQELFKDGELKSAETLLNTAKRYIADSSSTIIHMGIAFVPVVGDLADLSEAITGRDYVTGEALSPTSRVFAAAGTILGNRLVWTKAAEKLGPVFRAGLQELEGISKPLWEAVEHNRQAGTIAVEEGFHVLDQTSKIANPLPKNGRFAKVMERKYADGECPKFRWDA